MVKPSVLRLADPHFIYEVVLCVSISVQAPTQSKRKAGKKECFNDALETFYYGYISVWNIIKNHTDSQTGNPLPRLHGLLFLIDSKDILYALSH